MRVWLHAKQANCLCSVVFACLAMPGAIMALHTAHTELQVVVMLRVLANLHYNLGLSAELGVRQQPVHGGNEVQDGDGEDEEASEAQEGRLPEVRESPPSYAYGNVWVVGDEV